MANAIRWKGQWYLRESGKNAPNWRNRQNGAIIKKAPVVIVRRGMTNRVIVSNGGNFMGVEPTGRHYFFSDPKKSQSAKLKFHRSLKDQPRKNQRAAFARMKGGR